MNDLQINVVIALGSLLILLAVWLLVARHDHGPNSVTIPWLGLDVKLASTALVVLFTGAGLVIGPVLSLRTAPTGQAFLGAYFSPVPDDENPDFDLDHGAYVAHIEPGGPAHKAGILLGDVVLQINEDGIQLSTDVPPIIAKYNGGDKVLIILRRNGSSKTLNVRPGSKYVP